MSKPSIFISYSHKDEIWKNRLVDHLGVLQHENILDMWDDRRIGAGEDWYQEIQKAIDSASVAILLVSADFLTSQFILGKEIPRIMERREKEGLCIFPVIIRPCAWKQVKWLSQMNLRPKDGKPISGGTDFQIDADMAAVAEEVAGIIESASKVAQVERHVPLSPNKISLAKLPSTNPELFGREKELKMLDEAWANPKINIVTLVAWGGIGKTALVNTWLRQMEQENFRGAERVFGWSFYSQGASEGKPASADVFIASALRWFGDSEPEKGTPWEKGERLAEYVKKQKTLLILDGIEPLQAPSHEPGKIKDPGLQTLVRELAHHNSGLCIITTRLDVDDIKDFIGTMVENKHLEHLSDEAGIELLKHLGVKGSDDEVKQAVRDFGGHALALTLLGTYLSKVYKGDVRKRDRIAKLIKEEKYGGRAIQVMESYEAWFKGKPELNILSIMGLFDSPVESGAIEVLRANPPIKGLTSELKNLSNDDWYFALDNLRKAGLLAREDPLEPDALDCHPLIREYFGELLRNKNLEAWKEAHSRLYEYYKNQAKEYPGTIEEMLPLYKAVAHGCRAGRYQEAFKDIYEKRIQRRNEYFDVKKLGAFGANIAALFNFYELPWSQPVVELPEAVRSLILANAGSFLQALGRLKEETQPMKTGLVAYIEQKNWGDAAIVAGNFSDLYLNMGDIAQAEEYAKKSIELSDKSGIAIRRMVSRTKLSEALLQLGRIFDAEAIFQEVNDIQNKEFPKEKQDEALVHYLMSFRYCNLLLNQGKNWDVLRIANKTLKLAKEGNWLIEIALANLSIGRSYLFQALFEKRYDLSLASEHLNLAVDDLRRAGGQQYIILGLLSRAELYRVHHEFNKAQRDLDEAATIAERGEMGLYKADCRLGYARLYLAMGDEEKSRVELATAKEMIDKMGYHRRDREVRELEEQLK